jgi:hypothetical protein
VSDGYRRHWLLPLSECCPAALPQQVLRRILTMQHRDHRGHKTCPVSAVSSVCHDTESAITATLPTGSGQQHHVTGS